ncbi:rod shape-determining protein [Candidatus Woesebacteria bacterium]|nr:rod shape-determining protein [Candidatus Woesebacteria bacterium]
MISIIKNLPRIQFPFFSSFKVYFDLGTTNTRIAIKNKGIVMREPTFLGYNSKIKEYIFYGTEAKTILGKTPDFIHIVRPIVNSILYDFDASVAHLNYCINKAVRPYLSEYKFLKPPITGISSAPTIATEIEQKALEEALEKSECTEVTVIEKALATAAGCGYDIFSHEPRFVIDMGGGLIELSIISGGGIVAQRSLKTAGENMNKLIANYIYLKHGLILGEMTCEDLKIQLLNFTDEDKSINVRGKSLETGLPKSTKIKSSDVREALISQFNHVIDAAKEIMELAQPEVADSVYKNGIALTGNMASIPGIADFFTQELKIDSFVVEHYADATIHGLMRLDRDPENMFRLRGGM